ncbi:CoA transferase [Variovorax sp. YR216]|uniref:CaiB/BaiF CoA-transferase family protein n=1 Tax=Variovorax sp. YR216 TaxID=1882828 RepID=UPI00089943AF|nr:CoA transferase [Variovorax sp. YR216]SEB18625.1 Crotonobetainyl-CoA:carnitine CoA-transferase CaiB [Variovorax sp. YR216]
MVQPFNHSDNPGLIEGLRVLELCEPEAEYCGLLLAGLGAHVTKIEPLAGAASRCMPPLSQEGRSLYFHAYNRDKDSVLLDLPGSPARASLLALLEEADVFLCGSLSQLESATGLALAEIARRFPALITARITPFGDDGPWKDFRGSDLIHLALGGVMMNTGYDPDPQGRYDLPPITPQAFHAGHIACEQTLIGILGALMHRERTGEGQDVSCAIHTAVSVSTEMDLMSWVMRAAHQQRQTCRHSAELPNITTPLAQTKDGRWNLGWMVTAADEKKLVEFLASRDMAYDLTGPDPTRDPKKRDVPGATAFDEHKAHVFEVVQRFVRSFRFRDLPWEAAQAHGLMWAPLRKPHENLDDPHWAARGTYAWIDGLPYPRSKWIGSTTAWVADRAAPQPGEQRRSQAPTPKDEPEPGRKAPTTDGRSERSARGRPFALQGIRILDFSWFLASAGGTRMVTALGAECIKVEWKDNLDSRLGAMAPVGGREARRHATSPLQGVDDPTMGGHYNHKNAGKRGLSLNIRDPRGLEIARKLVAVSDVVAEGFSPGVMDRWGLGYEAMKRIRPDIVYVQQSGMGAHGRYGRMRTVGPIAAAFTGISEMSGLPEPAPPAGWGYSYLDWMGAYGFAQAILAGLVHRERTGQGQWIDASQCESGLMLTGVQCLEWALHRKPFTRTGNRSPYVPAAPHGAYRCAGEDRWIAIACFDDRDWQALVRAAGESEALRDPRFATLASRIAHQDALDEAVENWTRTQERYACMALLQSHGVAAGVCQTAEDRCEFDPQLAQQQWMTEVTAPRIGTWPITELPARLSRTPTHVGGLPQRGAPVYGEDNEYVLGELLGYASAEIRAFERDGVI